MDNYFSRTKYDGRLCFHRHVSVHKVPHGLWSQVLYLVSGLSGGTLVPGPFLISCLKSFPGEGVPPSTVTGPARGGGCPVSLLPRFPLAGERVLVMQWAVRLLRSRRTTFQGCHVSGKSQGKTKFSPGQGILKKCQGFLAI